VPIWGSRVPTHAGIKGAKPFISHFSHHNFVNTNAMFLKIDSIIFMSEIKKFGSYFKILFCRVRCGIEIITFYLQNLISIIKKLLFNQTMLKKTGGDCRRQISDGQDVQRRV